MKKKQIVNLQQTLFSLIMILALVVPAFGATAAPLSTNAQPVAAPQAPLAPSNWCVAGSFQGWDNASTPLYDDGSSGDLFAKDGIYSLDAAIATPGDYEWKVVQCGNWGVAFPAQNSWFTTSQANQTIKLTFDSNDHAGDAGTLLLPTKNIVNVWGDTLPASFTAVGDFQGWNNADPVSTLANEGNGIFQLFYTIPIPGSYIGKVTIDWILARLWRRRSFGRCREYQLHNRDCE